MHAPREYDYLDMQAEVGITKHMGGHRASSWLHDRCHLAEADRVLDVGCGIGVGPVTLAGRYGCRVVGLDVSEAMLQHARKRARRAGLSDRVTFVRADLRQLPFEDDRFDVVLVESVLSFVDDKAAALRELCRVLRPGGYLGLNESYWAVDEAPEDYDLDAQVGAAILTRADWDRLWAEVPLVDKHDQHCIVDARQEVRDRIAWVGWGSVLRAWGRSLWLYLSDRAFRRLLRELLAEPMRWNRMLGYGLFVGRKPPTTRA